MRGLYFGLGCVDVEKFEYEGNIRNNAWDTLHKYLQGNIKPLERHFEFLKLRGYNTFECELEFIKICNGETAPKYWFVIIRLDYGAKLAMLISTFNDRFIELLKENKEIVSTANRLAVKEGVIALIWAVDYVLSNSLDAKAVKAVYKLVKELMHIAGCCDWESFRSKWLLR